MYVLLAHPIFRLYNNQSIYLFVNIEWDVRDDDPV